MKNNTILIVIVIAIIAGGAGFLGGTKLQQSKVRNNFRQIGGQRNGVLGTNGQQRTGTGNGNRMDFRPVSGEITQADDKSITVKLADGSSKIVILSETTSINKADVAAKTDLKVGEKVAVFGQTNSDGSVTAQNIQLNPIENQFRLRNPDNAQPTP